MKNIVIVGARTNGHAKVVLEIVQTENKYTVIGFIDDNAKTPIRGIEVLGTMKDLLYLKEKHNIFGGIVAIGNNQIRRKLADDLRKSGLELINAIHPTVHIDSDVTYGYGNVFCQRAVIITGTKIGSCVNIHTGTTVDHDNIINDGANLGPGVHTAGRVNVGKDAFIGTGAVIIPDGVIGEGAIVGAGAVVLKSVEPYTLAVGVPAKKIKKLI